MMFIQVCVVISTMAHHFMISVDMFLILLKKLKSEGRYNYLYSVMAWFSRSYVASSNSQKAPSLPTDFFQTFLSVFTRRRVFIYR